VGGGAGGHRDPVDGMVAAEAGGEGLTGISRERVLAAYPAAVGW